MCFLLYSLTILLLLVVFFCIRLRPKNIIIDDFSAFKYGRDLKAFLFYMLIAFK